MKIKTTLKLSPALILISVFGLMYCKPFQKDSALKADLSPDARAAQTKGVRVFEQGNGTYKVQFPLNGTNVPSGAELNLRYGVVNKWSTEDIACGQLPGGPDKVKVKVNNGIAEFTTKVNPNAFSRCTDSSEGRKLSLECQQSKAWDGPKTLEGCLYDDDNSYLLGGRAAPEKGSAGGFGLAEEHTDDVLNYGRVCAARLGPLPRDWSCLDGDIIPITLNGEEVPFGEHQPTDKCDKPVYLGLGDQGQCVPYARLGRLYTAKNVETIFVCRRYKIGNERRGSRVSDHVSPDAPLFQDVAIIQHNVVTGESCFFQALSGFQPTGRDLPAARIPPPDEEEIPADILQKYASLPANQRPAKSSEFWIKPSDPGTNPHGRGFQCVKCHDSDPFMHSPYVDQLNFDYRFTSNRPGTIPAAEPGNMANPNLLPHPLAGELDKMVPCNPGKQGNGPGEVSSAECVLLKKGISKGKYSQVHKVHQDGWPDSYAIQPKDDDTCVKCHRVGSINACSSWGPDSVGDGSRLPSSTRRQRSEYGSTFPLSHWMPITADFFREEPECKPDLNNPENPPGCSLSLRTWRQSFERGADKQMECCQLAARNRTGDPAQDSEEFRNKCVRTPITTPPPSTGGGDTAELTAGQTEIADMDDTRISLGSTDNDGRVSFIKVELNMRHGNHGDLTITLSNGSQSAQIFDGQDLDAPNRGGRLNVQLNSADNQVFGQLIGGSGSGEWTLTITDSGRHETGNVESAKVTVSFQ